MYCLRALLLGSVLVVACGNPASPRAPDKRAPADPLADAAPVTPPFAVAAEAEGLLLVWYDAQGIHTATKRSEIMKDSNCSVQRLEPRGSGNQERRSRRRNAGQGSLAARPAQHHVEPAR